MSQDHLSAAEVAIFREDSFSSRSIEIGRHLLACKECRAKLPSVTPQEFRDCVLGADVVQPYGSERKRRFFDFKILSFARAAAFAGLAVVLVAGIYFVGVYRSSTLETTVAKNENFAGRDGLNPVVETTATTPTPLIENEQLPIKSVSRPDNDADRKRPSKKNDQRNIIGVAVREPKVRNVETRGNENPCSGGATINLESNSDGKEVFLKWNAVKGAQSYAIYISDLDENLIDHFESKSQTNYRSHLRFEPSKSYRWKLIIMMKNGKKIVGPPQVLNSAKNSDGSLKSGETDIKRGSFELRCVSQK